MSGKKMKKVIHILGARNFDNFNVREVTHSKKHGEKVKYNE